MISDEARAIVYAINQNILNPLITLLFGFATVYFLFGVVKYFQAEDDYSRDEGRKHMLWGVVGIFIMIAAYGIINVIAGSIDVAVPDTI